jgi:D-tyrosyl-tRNA(Tyr) deacylase
VRVGDRVVGDIGRGLLVLLGIGAGDAAADAKYVAAKVRDIRVFEGEEGRPMDRSVIDVGGSVLVVSQFTLYGDVRKGRRPAFDAAAPPSAARALYEAVVRELHEAGVPVATGEFQAMMQVELVNDGPVTILIDSHKQF